MIPMQGPRSNLAVFAQIVALVLGSFAVAWGLFCLYGAAFPGPRGDNPGPGLGVLEAYILDVPIGLLNLAMGLFVKRGSPRMRWLCIITALVALPIPIIANILVNRWLRGGP